MRDFLPERLPEDIEAERGLLATLCAPGMDLRAAEILPSLRTEDFMVPQHRAIFGAAQALVLRGEEINALTLKAELVTAKNLDGVGGFTGLTEILAAEEVGRPESLARLLQTKRQARDLVKIGAGIIREASEQVADPQEMAHRCAQSLLQAVEGGHGVRGEPQKVSKALQGLLDARVGGQEVTQGVMTGIHRLDKATGGFHPGNLVVVAARPGLGKTALALRWGLTAAQHGLRTGIWSLEMTDEELADRVTAQLGYLPAGWTRWKALSTLDADKIREARDHFEALPIEICDEAALTVPMIRLALMKARAKGDPYGFVIVDYLQLMSDGDPKRAAKQTDAARVGEMSRGLKLLAKEFKIPVILLSQLNREVEGRNNGRARLSDLRDSGAIEQDADIVVFINRKTDPATGKPLDDGDLAVAKTRHGIPDAIPNTFVGSKMTFLERTQETAPPPSVTSQVNGFDW